MLTGFSGIAAGNEQVGLTAQERRDLQAVDDLADGFGLGGFMDIGQNRQTGFGADAVEDLQALFQPRPAKAVDAGAVGLVEAGLENTLDAGVFLQILTKTRRPARRQRLTFDHTRSGDDKKITVQIRP